MDDLGIGKPITGDDRRRDAIHVAVAPVVAGEKLYPGQHVSAKAGRATSRGDHIGIVDPFLPAPVFPEERFWLFLYVGSISSLRHHWEHPALGDGDILDAVASAEGLRPGVNASRDWIRQYASGLGLEYDELMEAAVEWIDSGTYLNGGSRFDGTYMDDEFWHHYTVATGKVVPREKRDNFFTCSC